MPDATPLRASLAHPNAGLMSGTDPGTGSVGFDRFLRYFLWLGALGFGGPIATVGYLQRDLVEPRRWLDRQGCRAEM